MIDMNEIDTQSVPRPPHQDTLQSIAGKDGCRGCDLPGERMHLLTVHLLNAVPSTTSGRWKVRE